MARAAQPNLTVATKSPQGISTLLSKPPPPGSQPVLPSDEATHLPHVVVQPDVLRVLPQAVLPALRGGAAAGPAAGKSEREDTCEQKKIRRESLGQELKDIQWVCSKGRESPSLDLAINMGASWRLASPWETTWEVTGQHSPKGQKS